MQGLTDLGRRAVHFGDVPVLEALISVAHVQTEVDGGRAPRADAALLHGRKPASARRRAFAARQATRRVAQHEGPAPFGIIVGELHSHDAAEGFADIHGALYPGVVEDGQQVAHQRFQGGLVVGRVNGRLAHPAHVGSYHAILAAEQGRPVVPEPAVAGEAVLQHDGFRRRPPRIGEVVQIVVQLGVATLDSGHGEPPGLRFSLVYHTLPAVANRCGAVGR